MKTVRPLLGVSPTSTPSCCFRLIYSLVLCFCAGLTQPGYSQATTSSPILEFGFTHVNQTNADDYLVETSGVRKYSEWQNPPTTYWGPSQNNVEGVLVYRFPLPQAAASFYLKANDSSWDFNNEPGGFGRGCSALEVSRDGVNWIVLRNSLDSRQWGVDWSYEGDLPHEMIGATEVWLRLRFLCEGAPNSSYTVTQFGRSSSAATENVFDFRAYPVLRGQPPRFNTFMLQSSQAGSTTDIDNLRVIDLDTGEVVYSNDFSDASKATGNLQLFHFPQGGANTTNFVVNGPMTRIVNGKLRLETTGFGANGSGGYESHSEAEYTQPLPHNFLVEFDAVRLQWAGHFHFHVSYRDPSDPPSSAEPFGAYATNRIAPYRLDTLRMAASGSWFQKYGLNTDATSTSSSSPISFPAPPGSLQQTHKLGISLSNNIARFYLDGQLLNSAPIDDYLGPSSDFDGDGVNDYREQQDGTDPNDPESFNPLSKGLVAYYPFDGSANDESGYLHNARAFNAAFSTGVGDVPDTAVEFDGVSAYLTATVPVPAEDRFSWALWVNAGRIDSEAWLVNRVREVGVNLVEPALVINKDTEGYGREPDASLAFYSFDGSEQKLFTPGQIIPHSMWIHVAVTRASDGNSRIYANGTLVAEGTSTSLDPLETIVLGANGQVPTFFFEGKMDNVRVYNRDLSPADIRMLYVSEAGDLDSDSDGLYDVHETKTGTFVSATEAGTDPYNPDTSGDGLRDGEVVGAGFDPTKNYTPLFSLVKTKSIVDQQRMGLFTEGAMMDLNLGGVVLRKSGSIVNLRLQIQSKMDLHAAEWNNEGTETFILDVPGNKAFMRIRALGPQ